MLRKTFSHRGQPANQRFVVFWSMAIVGLVVLGIGILGCGTSETPASGQESSDSLLEERGVSAVPPPQSEVAQRLGEQAEEAVEPRGAADDDEVAIQVNDHVVTYGEFERELGEQIERLEQQLGDIEHSPEIQQRLALIREQMKGQLVEQMVTRALLDDFLEKSDVEVSEEEIDREWEQIVAQFPDQQALEAALQQEGVTVAEIREQVERQVKFDKALAREIGEVEVTGAEVEAFYDMRSEDFAQPAQVRARHILISDAEDAEAAAHAIHKRIEEGEDFAALAAEHSACPSGQQGGDLGFFGAGQMVEPFSRQAFAMEAGEVSAPVKTEFGYHIIKVEERREAKQAEFAEVEDAIKEHLEQQQGRAKQEEFFDQLRQTAQITINVDTPEPQPVFPQDSGSP